ncbi:MAG: 7,8-didemethyl-8-hydroxy-5-deazariboflavin synthase CofG, partial [Alphaproteobacteria bacterium]
MDSANFTAAYGLPTDDEIRALISQADLGDLIAEAARLRDEGHGRHITYSRKVFIALTHLCRDSCGYCTYARPPAAVDSAYLSPDEVLAIARAGARAGCREALFTLGDKPELRYRAARDGLAALGHDSTISYLKEMCALVLEETGLLPHVNAGVMDGESIALLRSVSVSQGLMLESAAPRLCEPGGPHHGAPDKDPAARLATIEAAGEESVPFTTGILIGIGETREERIDALLAIRGLHRAHRHIQEIIVQNFRAKPGTRMAAMPEPDLEEMQWTIAAARIIFGPAMNIQAPPNLSMGAHGALIAAGINDWGGVSPVTPDHVNPEAPWPELDALGASTAASGKLLVERLAIYPEYVRDNARWQDPDMAPHVLRASDCDGLARDDNWSPGTDAALPAPAIDCAAGDPKIRHIIETATGGAALEVDDIAALFRARGADLDAVCEAADALRRGANGDDVTYVVNRNINYTNICNYACSFCAFSKGGSRAGLRGAPYDLTLEEIGRRAAEAWSRGATEVCLQGGIHPDYTGRTYIDICRAVKEAAPGIHIHAFSPLEVWQGAETLGLAPARYLERLMEAGLDTLPGTAAEVLDDDVRAVLCPDKLSVAQWREIIEAAHEVGFRTTATIMFGHMEGPQALARH